MQARVFSALAMVSIVLSPRECIPVTCPHPKSSSPGARPPPGDAAHGVAQPSAQSAAWTAAFSRIAVRTMHMKRQYTDPYSYLFDYLVENAWNIKAGPMQLPLVRTTLINPSVNSY